MYDGSGVDIVDPERVLLTEDAQIPIYVHWVICPSLLSFTHGIGRSPINIYIHMYNIYIIQYNMYIYI